MKRLILIAALLVAAGLAGQAQAQAQGMGGGAGGDGYGGGTNDELAVPGSRGPSDPAGTAEELRLQGKCVQALPTLRRIADRGPSYANSQYDLGECLLDLAKKEHDAAHAADMVHEGAIWVLRAANAGYSKAQAEAVTIYLDGTGIKADPVEAEKWALLYHDNGMRLAIGLPDIAQDVSDRLDAVLTDATRAQARARADAWTSTQNLDQ